ncbi:hypothetical protein [Sphingomonas sp. F9_3S_D5_B_2]
MSDDPIERMRARVEQCRRIAAYINDPRAIAILRQMADEGAMDIKRLEAEREQRPHMDGMPHPNRDGPRPGEA